MEELQKCFQITTEMREGLGLNLMNDDETNGFQDIDTSNWNMTSRGTAKAGAGSRARAIPKERVSKRSANDSGQRRPDQIQDHDPKSLNIRNQILIKETGDKKRVLDEIADRGINVL